MTNRPIFRTLRKDTLVDKRLSVAELKKALDEIERLTWMEWPTVDWTVTPVAVTNHEWHRQKLPDERFRSILKINFDTQEISIIAILVRDENTYRKVVRQLYLKS